MATEFGSGRGRFVAERGLYCLPTWWRFELAEESSWWEQLDCCVTVPALGSCGFCWDC
jgi:hypothetical protein